MWACRLGAVPSSCSLMMRSRGVAGSCGESMNESGSVRVVGWGVGVGDVLHNN